MSFKREGNDTNLLGTLRKRRIKELLTEDIPEDEAKLLCNGRFACTVCSSNPVFDTVSMLSVHRQGKKHLFNLEIHERKKKELKQLIARRKHEQFLKDGTTSIKMAELDHKGILTASPYDPRVKKLNVKHGERKPVLDLDEGATTSTGYSGSSHHSATRSKATEAKDLPGDSPSYWQKACEQQMCGPIEHDHQLKKIFGNKNNYAVRTTPYQTKRKLTPQISSAEIVKRSPASDFSTTSTDNIQVKSYSSTSAVNVSQKNSVHLHTPKQQQFSLAAGTLPVNPSTCQFHHAATVQPPPPPLPPSVDAKTTYASNRKVSSTVKFTKSQGHHTNTTCEQKDPVAARLRQLQGSGWKRDWDGKWIKDENAEFDSDEEPPNIPFVM